MDQLQEFVEAVRSLGATRDRLLGMLHILVGRRIDRADGVQLSTGLNWRQAAGLLKLTRWDPGSVAELRIDPSTLPIRDRQRFWYSVISLADIASPVAIAAGNRLAEALLPVGYVIGPAPGA